MRERRITEERDDDPPESEVDPLIKLRGKPMDDLVAAEVVISGPEKRTQKLRDSARKEKKKTKKRARK